MVDPPCKYVLRLCVATPFHCRSTGNPLSHTTSCTINTSQSCIPLVLTRCPQCQSETSLHCPRPGQTHTTPSTTKHITLTSQSHITLSMTRATSSHNHISLSLIKLSQHWQSSFFFWIMLSVPYIIQQMCGYDIPVLHDLDKRVTNPLKNQLSG